MARTPDRPLTVEEAKQRLRQVSASASAHYRSTARMNRWALVALGALLWLIAPQGRLKNSALGLAKAMIGRR